MTATITTATRVFPLRGVLRGSLALALLIVLAEGALTTLGLADPVLLQPDSSCQYLLRPNQDHYRFFVHTHTNTFGMRSDDFPFVKSAEVNRLLFVGDSIPYGTTRVDQDKLFTSILQRELPGLLHCRIELLNASASGWAISNELGFVRSRGIFNSDRVILVLNNVDLGQKVATATEIGSSLFFDKPACAICEITHRFLTRHRSDPGTVQLTDNAREDANLADLDTFRNVVAAGGAKMLILFVPFRGTLSESKPTVLQSKLVLWAKNADIPIVDSTALLLRMTVKQATLDGAHLTNAGNRAVANAFEQSLGTLALAKN